MINLLDLKFDIAVAGSRKSTHWKPNQVTWSQLLERFKKPFETSETYEQYMQMSKADQDGLKDKGGFVGGKLREGKRKRGYVEGRQLLCLDMDFGTLDFWEGFTLLYDYTCCIHSTHKHSKENPRYRLVLPLSRSVSEEEYEAVARKIAEHLGIDLFDDTTYEPTRLMYWPSRSKDGEYFFDHQEGAILNVDEILSEYKDWHDCRQWPRSSRAKKIVHRELKLLGDPSVKEGIIGAFCSAYGIDEAIDTFLSDMYVACDEAGPNRYTYSCGSTSGGAIVYDNQYLYSHHSTDPAQGASRNSFDLVRLHLFGDLDEAVKEGTKKLPSMKAMIELAQQDVKVKDTLNQSVLEAFGGEEKQIDLSTITYYNGKGVRCLDAYKLAKAIREHCAYLIVRKQGYDSEFLYWYENGYYKLISPNEFKGKIKSFIPAELCKPHAWEEVYKHLLTDTATTDYEELNNCEDYINFKNGLYNVKTKCLESHSKDIICSIQLNATYVENAPEPKVWLEFISRLGNYDTELIAILQEWVGLTLSNVLGYRPKKCLALVSKVGNTGKTQFNNLLCDILGNSNICSTPIQKFDKAFGLGSIYGAKAILIDDQTATTVEDSSNFKQITSGGKIDCEIKGKQSFPYTFKGTLSFGCNDLPYFRGDKGNHLFERIIIIACEKVLDEHERISDIKEQMLLEVDGIIQWALKGLHRLLDKGYMFTQSVASDEAMKEYRGMNDSLYRFVTENYTVTKRDKDRVSKSDLEQAYHKWCIENDIEPMKKKNIVTRASKQGINIKRSNGLYYTGLKALGIK